MTRPGPDRPRRLLSSEESGRRWDEFTLERLRSNAARWLSDRWEYELPLLRRITREIPAGARVLEVGAGGGANALWLAARGYDVVGIDYRPRVVAAARELAASLGIPCAFCVADAFDLDAFRGFDLVFSAGVIEHWDRMRTIEALAEQSRCATKVLAVIPTPNTRFTAETSDERFYSRRELERIFREAGLVGVRGFGYGAVPTTANRVLRHGLPPAVFSALQDRWNAVSMSRGAVGAVPGSRGPG